MKRKNLSILLSLLTIFSATTFVVSGLSFAWINWNRSIENKLTLTSGTDVLNIEYYTYIETWDPATGKINRIGANTDPHSPDASLHGWDASFGKDENGYYVKPEPPAGQQANGKISYEQTETAITVTYNPVLNPDLLSFYNDETSLNFDPLPKLYFEIRYIKEVSNGYLKGKIINTTKGTQSNLFKYRFLPTTQYLTNNLTDDYTCALKQGHLELLRHTNDTDLASPLTRKPFFVDPSTMQPTTEPIDLFLKDDICKPKDPSKPEPGDGNYDPSKEAETQCFVPSYKTPRPGYEGEGYPLSHYSKASLIEISIDEDMFKQEAIPKLVSGQPVPLNISFDFEFDFSNSPYYVASQAHI